MKLRAIFPALFVVAALCFAGCGSSSDSPPPSGEKSAASPSTESGESSSKSGESSSESSESVPKGSPNEKKTKPTVTVPTEIPPTEFAIKEIEEGTGPEAKTGDKVTVQYVGVGYKTEEEFDSSWSRNEPFSFTLGKGKVIKGWEEGVKGMKAGGRREMLIPAKLAYGAAGKPPKIPPNEALVFTVDLVSAE